MYVIFKKGGVGGISHTALTRSFPASHHCPRDDHRLELRSGNSVTDMTNYLEYPEFRFRLPNLLVVWSRARYLNSSGLSLPPIKMEYRTRTLTSDRLQVLPLAFKSEGSLVRLVFLNLSSPSCKMGEIIVSIPRWGWKREYRESVYCRALHQVRTLSTLVIFHSINSEVQYKCYNPLRSKPRRSLLSRASPKALSPLDLHSLGDFYINHKLIWHLVMCWCVLLYPMLVSSDSDTVFISHSFSFFFLFFPLKENWGT